MFLHICPYWRIRVRLAHGVDLHLFPLSIRFHLNRLVYPCLIFLHIETIQCRLGWWVYPSGRHFHFYVLRTIILHSILQGNYKLQFRVWHHSANFLNSRRSHHQNSRCRFPPCNFDLTIHHRFILIWRCRHLVHETYYFSILQNTHLLRDSRKCPGLLSYCRLFVQYMHPHQGNQFQRDQLNSLFFQCTQPCDDDTIERCLLAWLPTYRYLTFKINNFYIDT